LIEELTYHNKDHVSKWFYNRYYYNSSNSRYWTFQLALNILSQTTKNPVIVETGCQREEEDIGAGMSTSIFAEYVHRYGGTLEVVDNERKHLTIAEKCVTPWNEKEQVKFHLSDSVCWLEEYEKPIDLLYLDSWDYPVCDMAWSYHSDFETGLKILENMPEEELKKKFADKIDPCQIHCLREFQAVENQLTDKSILLVDDNRFPAGGKPGLLKPYLVEKGWKCLLDFQQTIWKKSI